MKFSNKALVILFICIISGFFGFSDKVLADYQTAGVFVSTNILPSSGAELINNFSYTATVPANTGLKVQFSYDGSIWYNSSGTNGGWDALSTGTNTIDLSARVWRASYFYYRMFFTSTDGVATPSLDSITLSYNSYSGAYDTYNTSGSFTSTNLLSGQTATTISSFAYTVLSLPTNTAATVQFSTDNSTWYNSSGANGGSNTLSAGTNTISLSGLSWSGSSFYYKMSLTSDGAHTPEIDSITLSFFAPATFYWVGGTGNWSNAASHWALTSNGSPGSGNAPTSVDSVVFDSNSGGGTATIDANVSVVGVSITSGYTGAITQSGSYTLTVGSSGFAQAGGTFTGGSGAITDSGVFTLSGGTFTSTSGILSIAGNFANSGTFTHNSGTVTFNGTTAISGSSTNSFNNLTITGAFTAPSANMNIAGNFSDSGTFTANSGTVTLNGTSQTISGSNTFYNLTKSVSTAATLTFTQGTTQTISNTLTLNGTSGNLLSLRSSSTPTQWLINPQATRTISYLDVKDSNNTNSTGITVAGLNITDSGNNTNWLFDTTPPVQSAWAPATAKVINTATPTITLTLNEAGDCRLSLLDDSYDLASDDVDCTGDGTTSITCVSSSLAPDGTNKNVYIACKDTLGNKDTNATNTNLTYTLDTTNPTVTITSPLNAANLNNTSVSFAATATDTNLGSLIPNLDSSLVSWWRMDDVDGSGNPTDYIGSNNGTKYGDAVQTANGKFGKGFAFDGNGDYIALPNMSVVSLFGDTFTLSFWANPGSVADRPTFGFTGSGSANAANPFCSYDSYLNIGNGVSAQVITALPNAPANTWTNYLILDNSTHYVVYINGIYSYSSAITVNPNSASNRIFVLGQSGFDAPFTQAFNGLIDDVLIFNRALTTDEITGLYNATAISHSSTLSEASHTYKVYAEDLAANVGSSGPNTFTVDVTAPTNQDTVFAASTSKQGGASVTIVSSGDATNNVWFAPSGTTSFVAGATMTTAGGTATTILAPATAGAYRMFVIDAAGNYSTQSTAILTVDNTAPTVSSVAVQAGLTVNVVFSEAMGTGVTTASNYTVSGTGKGTLASNPNTAALVSGSTYVLTWTSGEMFNGGDITIAVANAQDAVGNAVGSPNSGTHTGGGIGVAPTLSFTDDVAAGPVASDTITGDWGDATTKKWDYDSDGVCSATSGDYSKTDSDSMNQSVQTNNTKYICLYGADAAGNSATQPSANDINIDITAPTGTSISSITADSTTQLTVTSTTATDSGVGLHATPYQFEEITGNSGATSSSFQASTTYIDTGLTPNTQYTYKVRAKDSLSNTSEYSTTSSKYTLAAVPGTPSLNADSASQITATLSADSNPVDTEYYFENTSNSTNSGWTANTSWASSGLTGGTSYSFKVKARNGNNTETDYSSTASKTTLSLGGGGLPVGAYMAPTAPLNGFQILINGGAATTDSQNVNLTLRGSFDTPRMSISNDPNFTNAIQESYDIIKQWKLSDGQGLKIVYVKFFTAYGVPSNTIAAAINYQIPSIITPIINIINPPAPQNPPEITPIPPLPPVTEVVKPEAPLSMQDIWNLLPTQAINQFVLSPVPQEISDLVQKFPNLEKTFQEIGILKITDISKLINNNLTLPNFSQIVNPTGPSLTLEDLTALDKQKIPTEILFVKTSGGLVDYNTTLSLNEQGHPQQQFNTIVNQSLQLIVKADSPAKAVRGYFIFKQNSMKSASKISASDLTASLLQQEIDINQVRESAGLKQALVLSTFDFADPEKDNIWTADIVTPPVDGQYEVIVVIDYQDQRLQPKELTLVTVVDPEGYVYTQMTGGIKGRVPNARVAIYWLNPVAESYELWPAKDYQQVNPQITDDTGKYSFLVPEGTYYLKVEAKGYSVYQGDIFEVKTGNGIHQNIELQAKNWWLRFFDWKVVVLIIFGVLLAYNFYSDIKKRKQNNRA